MTTTFGVSARSALAAGVATVALGAVAVTPLPAVTMAGAPMPALVSPAVALSAAVQPLQQPVANATAAVTGAGDSIIAAYNALQPWVAYGYQLAQWAVSWVPGLWLVAPAIDLAYYTWQPIGEALVYSFADLLNGQPELIPPTLSQGIQNSANNFVVYAVNWVYSIVPFPPLPPIPIFNGFAAASTAPAATGRGLVSARTAASVAPIVATEPAAGPDAPVIAAPVIAAPVIDAPVAPTRARAASARPAPAARAAAATAVDSVSSAVQGAAQGVTDAVAPARAAARSAHPAQHESRR